MNRSKSRKNIRFTHRANRVVLAAVLALALGAQTACHSSAGAPVADADWPSYASSNEQHYSPLAQIDQSNVGTLGLAWAFDIPGGGSSLSAPVEHGGVVYFVSGHAVVHALNAVDGKQLWQYDPEVHKVAGFKMRGTWGTRGLAFDKGKLFVGTADGRLIAIDAKSGKPLWSSQTLSPTDSLYITGAPWVFGNTVIIGNGGADFGPVRGYVTAYDQNTGRQLWRFHTVPGDPAKGFENEAMAMAAKTWKGEWWKYGGGGTVWNAMAYDKALNRIYIGVGNGAPWNQKIRSPGGGDNLFLASVVALDADSGEYIWHYQTNPGETWDFSSAMDIILAELEIDGAMRQVILHAPKNGFFYVIDRKTGKLISAEKLVHVNWAKGIDIATGRPIENPEARYPDGKGALVAPSASGAHNIEAMSFSPQTKLAYVPVSDRAEYYIDPPAPLKDWQFAKDQQATVGLGAFSASTSPSIPKSALIAWNPITQKQAWRHDMSGLRSFGGTAVTGGDLVFAGNVGGNFVAYAADSGKQLWSFDAQTAVTAQPIVYAVGGKQYVTVIAGARQYNSSGAPRRYNYRSQTWRVLTFALNGKARLPAPVHVDEPILDDATFQVDAARAARGGGIFAVRCLMCHGVDANASGAAPSLLTSSVVLDPGAFRSVMIDGVLAPNGMPRFENLKDGDLLDLRHYIRARARDELARAKAPDTRAVTPRLPSSPVQ